MRYRLLTLMIVLAVLPPLIAEIWMSIATYRARRQRELQQARGATPVVVR